ncbi:MAG: Brp/Blh family beta-carotene 15,15'-dioxygenase [Chthoniobacterales bacterium]
MSTWFPAFQRRHTLFVVALLAAALATSPFVPAVPLGLQLTVLALAVVVFGLPHGALDLALVRGAAQGSRLALAAAIGVYLVVSAAILAVWIAFPVAALLGFLAIAVIHFGLGDTEDRHGPQRAVEVIARGGFAGIAPLVFHPQTTRDLFALLVGPASSGHLDAALAVITAPATWLWITCLIVAVLWRSLQRAPGWLPAVAELLLTAAIFAVFHPLSAFLLYFCFVHSVRHISDLGAARFPESAARARRWLLLESLPFTLATVVLGAIAWFAFARTLDFDEAMMRVIFWGLSALTMPHMILTAWWHGRGEPQPGDLFARHV